MLLFIIYNLTLLSCTFSIGCITVQLLRYKTQITYNILILLVSLFFISCAFYMNVLKEMNLSADHYNLEIVELLIYLTGAGMNIYIQPYLVTSLTNRYLSNTYRVIFGIWTSIYIILTLLVFLQPQLSHVKFLLLIMLLLSILVAIIYITINLHKVKKIWWYRSLKNFLLLTSMFLITLILDMAITIYNISFLSFLDNLSLPLYLLFINIGITLFSIKHLSKSVMIKQGRLTSGCISFYNLSPREVEVIESLSKGITNREVSEELFISIKTVENHLTNIYKKIRVKGRVQLLQVLNSWSTG